MYRFGNFNQDAQKLSPNKKAFIGVLVLRSNTVLHQSLQIVQNKIICK